MVMITCLFLVFSDYHRKEKTLKALKKKALDKNPDEFYFNMVRSQTEVCVVM